MNISTKSNCIVLFLPENVEDNVYIYKRLKVLQLRTWPFVLKLLLNLNTDFTNTNKYYNGFLKTQEFQGGESS